MSNANHAVTNATSAALPVGTISFAQAGYLVDLALASSDAVAQRQCLDMLAEYAANAMRHADRLTDERCLPTFAEREAVRTVVRAYVVVLRTESNRLCWALWGTV